MNNEHPPQRNESDVARLLKEIDMNYQAASLGLEGLALGTSMHSFITARMEKIEEAREQLVDLVGDPDEATRLVIEQMNKSADTGDTQCDTSSTKISSDSSQ